MKEISDECDVLGDTSGRAVELRLSDRAEGCDGVECGFGRREVPKSAHRTEQPLEGGVITLDAVVEMLSRDVPDGSADE